MAATTIVFEIPFIPATPQSMTVTLNGFDYNLRTYWCGPANCWVLDIDDANSSPLIHGVPVITGANLLQQYQDLLPGQLLVISDHGPPGAVPTFDSLGATGHLYDIPPT